LAQGAAPWVTMLRVSIKNTFLSFDDEEQAHQSIVKGASPRSRSAHSPRMTEEEIRAAQMQIRLERLANLVGGTAKGCEGSPEAKDEMGRQRASSAEAYSRPLPDPSSPPLRPVIKAMSSNAICSMATGIRNEQDFGGECFTGDPDNMSDEARQIVQELQRRVRHTEAMRPAPLAHVGSTNSVSSMPPNECQSPASWSSLPHAMSSNSLSSAGRGGSNASLSSMAHMRRVASNNSLSSQNSEVSYYFNMFALPSGATSPLQHVSSQGSVSTMDAEFLNNGEEEGTTDFCLTIEEGESGPSWGVRQVQERQEPQENHIKQSSRKHREGRENRFENGTKSPPENSPKNSQKGGSRSFDGVWRPTAKDYRHGHVPKNLNLTEQFEKSGHDGPPTTLMIRNIPNCYTQRELIQELEGLGFAGSFDFLYMPVDKGTLSNVGYAFVNFVDGSWADKCMRKFSHYRFKRHRMTSGKIASVSVAHLQGLEQNLRHYERAAVSNCKFKQRRPVVMANISGCLQAEVETVSPTASVPSSS